MAVSYTHLSEIDLDLYITDANFNIIESSTGVERQETVDFVPDRFGKYYLIVERFSGTTGRYQVDLSVFGCKFRFLESLDLDVFPGLQA